MSTKNPKQNMVKEPAVNKKADLLNQMSRTHLHYKNMIDFFEPVILKRELYTEALRHELNCQSDDEIIHHLRNREGLPMLIKDDINFNTPMINNHFLALLDIMKNQTASGADLIEKMIRQKEYFCFEDLIDRNFNKVESPPDSTLLDFLIDETLGPMLEIHAEKLKEQINNKWLKHFCPVCGKSPAFGLLKANDGKKLLVCSLCAFQWEFARIKCSFCGNEDQKLLSYFVIEDDEMYRIEICDACGCYLKTINLKNTSHEVFFNIESIITLHLDIIAREKGYSYLYSPTKITTDRRSCRYAGRNSS